MNEELELLETDSELPAYNAVCDLVEEVERLQAACAAKEAELAELREQTAELFGARLEAEGMSEEAVTAAKAMWQHDPENAARAVLGCDIMEAANPYGCNQYGHEWKGKHGEGWKPSGRGGESGKKKGGDNEKKAETPEKKDERKGPPKRPDGSFIIPSIGKAKAIPTYIPKPKGLSEREQLINDTVYRPEWQVRKPVRNEADKALNKLRERLKRETPGSETWTKYKTHENSVNGFVSRMLNSTTERQRREQMRFLLQYLEPVDKDLNS